MLELAYITKCGIRYVVSFGRGFSQYGQVPWFSFVREYIENGEVVFADMPFSFPRWRHKKT